MELNIEKLTTIVIQAGSLISVFAGIVAAIIMSKVTKKFGTGVLASGFKSISVGVIFIAIGIFIDAIQTYIQLSYSIPSVEKWLIIVKYALYVVGTYIIVIGSKKTGDQLESLTK